MLSIGQFSRATGLTVKTLRFYHEQGVLIPTSVDPDSGYRYYAESKIEQARVVVELRHLGFPLSVIAEIVSSCDDEADILDHVEQQRQAIHRQLTELEESHSALESIIQREREARLTMQNATYEVEQKTVDKMLIAGIRMKGKYADCGQAFARIGRKFGRHICGKAFLLHFDDEYKEADADFEACMPIRGGVSVDGIEVRELPGGTCASLLYKGPYGMIGPSYGKIAAYMQDSGNTIALPTREVYIKGPGMIFKGNPKKYLTEIQMFSAEN